MTIAGSTIKAPAVSEAGPPINAAALTANPTQSTATKIKTAQRMHSLTALVNRPLRTALLSSHVRSIAGEAKPLPQYYHISKCRSATGPTLFSSADYDGMAAVSTSVP
jgi:hypothetical protein